MNEYDFNRLSSLYDEEIKRLETELIATNEKIIANLKAELKAYSK